MLNRSTTKQNKTKQPQSLSAILQHKSQVFPVKLWNNP